MVWVPLPSDFTWPHAEAPGDAETAAESDGDTSDAWSADQHADSDDEAQATDAEDEATGGEGDDALPEQEDERWEQALPLNGTNVGDPVVPALPISPADRTQQATAATDAAHTQASTIFDAGRSYDWLKPST